MEERLYSLIVEKEELNWKEVLLDIIKKEGMDPWNIDVAKLTKKYIERVKEFKKKDFKVSGNVILCAALLVKMKSHRLVEEDIDALDRLIASQEQSSDEFYDDLEREYLGRGEGLTDEERKDLIPRVPQERERKVSIQDLVSALEKALEVKKRKVIRRMPELKVTVPQKKMDIVLLVKQVYKKILTFLLKKKKKTLHFRDLLEKKSRGEIITTFIPILQLANDHKIDLSQSKPFGDIDIELIDKTRIKE